MAEDDDNNKTPMPPVQGTSLPSMDELEASIAKSLETIREETGTEDELGQNEFETEDFPEQPPISTTELIYGELLDIRALISENNALLKKADQQNTHPLAPPAKNTFRKATGYIIAMLTGAAMLWTVQTYGEDIKRHTESLDAFRNFLGVETLDR